MTPAEALEVVGRRLTPEVLCALAGHLADIRTPARSEIVIHHGRLGTGVAMDAHVRVKTKRVDFPEGEAPQSAR